MNQNLQVIGFCLFAAFADVTFDLSKNKNHETVNVTHMHLLPQPLLNDFIHSC